MGYKIYQLQNASGWDDAKPTIIINEHDNDWDKCYEDWKTGKDPTNSPEWSKGVFALTKEIEKK